MYLSGISRWSFLGYPRIEVSISLADSSNSLLLHIYLLIFYCIRTEYKITKRWKFSFFFFFFFTKESWLIVCTRVRNIIRYNLVWMVLACWHKNTSALHPSVGMYWSTAFLNVFIFYEFFFPYLVQPNVSTSGMLIQLSLGLVWIRYLH